MVKNPEIRAKLEQLRVGLLALHKALVESERVTYEETMGKISSPNHFLQLVTNDPWFAWLKPVSSLIVVIDEVLDEKEQPLTAEMASGLFKQAGNLLVTSEVGEGFPQHYFNALQRDPDVVLAHADVAKMVRTGK